MLIMKKDMGGAACVLGAAHMIMDAKLKVRLRVLIPAVENAISGDAFRPLDIYTLAQGHHGRDRQYRRRGPAGARRCARARRRGGARADRRHGDADRRGARRARSRTAAVLHRRRRARGRPRAPCAAPRTTRCGACRCGGPTSRCSIPRPPTSTTVGGSFAGSITAALFLQPLRHAAKAWAHFDIYAWTPRRPSRRRPEGGECQAARALYALLKERYGLMGLRRHLETIRLRNDRSAPWPSNCGPSQALQAAAGFHLRARHRRRAGPLGAPIAILLTIYLEPPPHTVRGLAAKLR